ncbi:MAG: cation-translocating P-type ATPase [Actinomycetota bacterium]
MATATEQPEPEAVRVDPKSGLRSDEVAERVARGLVNDVPTQTTRSVAQIVRANVITRFNIILGSMLVVILTVGPIQDALFGGVLIANALIGIVQELRAKRTLDELAVLTTPKARIVRDGDVAEYPIGEVVLDDVLELQPGDQVVVDGDVLDADGLEIDESLITGESDPVLKHVGDPAQSGSFVAAGSGRFIATKVGRAAYAAKLAIDARRFTLTQSELRSGTDTILKYVTWAIVPTAALLFWSQLRGDASVAEGLRGAVAGVVAMVPEGLVLLTSLAFAISVVRLARKRVLVQELPAVEGLARVDVLCIDKTGTLTEGRLTVEDVELLEGDAPYEDALAALARVDAHPNATMGAIGERFARVPDDWHATTAVPFSSARRWSGATFRDRGSWILGAPEAVLGDGLTSDRELARAIADRAEQGQRVVLLTHADAGLDEEGALPQSIEPVAIVALADQPRPDAAATLGYFREQDVTVKVISGDDPRTVAAIAGRLGLEGAQSAIDARELPEENVAALGEALEERTVFGRVSPQQKRAMVQALQTRGHTVAMTGDGVNDALALKDADLGIAMGSGSPATRSVAQLVLLDSTFDAIPQVVGEGRRVLGNIQRTSNLYVTKTVYAMLISIATGVLGFVFPFLPRHLTLIGSLTIGIPSFFLALAPSSERWQPGFLHRVLRFSIPAGALAALATYLSYTFALDTDGVSLREAQTTATMVLCWIGLLVLSIVASPLNTWKLVLIWTMGALFVLAVILPFTQEFFALETPPLIVWLAAFGIASIVWSAARLFVPHPKGSSGVPLMD